MLLAVASVLTLCSPVDVQRFFRSSSGYCGDGRIQAVASVKGKHVNLGDAWPIYPNRTALESVVAEVGVEPSAVY